MKTDQLLIGYGLAVGLASGIIATMRPALQTAVLPPYLWVLIAMALFEAILFARSGGNPAAMPSLGARLGAFVAGAGLAFGIPMLAAPAA